MSFRRAFTEGFSSNMQALGGWMIVECIVAIGAGFTAGSFALIAFEGDSFIELISAGAVASYLRGLPRGELIPFSNGSRSIKTIHRLPRLLSNMKLRTPQSVVV